MKIRFVVASCAFVAMLVMSPAARAELIAYEGFGYDIAGSNGYLDIVDGGDNAGDPTLDTGVFDHLDDGTGAGFDANTGVASTILDDPGRNGGTGWATSWLRRLPENENRSALLNDTSTLTYMDSQGKSLATTVGKPVFGSKVNVFRAFETSSLVDLTIPNDVENLDELPEYDQPRLGKQDTTIWFSFLGDRNTTQEDGKFMGMQFLNKQLAMGSDTTRSAGIYRGAEENDWQIWDAKIGSDPVGSTGTGMIPGTATADDDQTNGDIFIVTKLDYSATTTDDDGAAVTNGYANLSIFVDPDLGSTEPTSPALTAQVYIAFNGVLLVNNTGNVDATSSLDEIRIGTTYADVAPIAGAAGLDGDFDSDGDVDGADFLAWQRGDASGGATPANLTLWENNFGSSAAVASTGAVPEPTSIVLLGMAGVLSVLRRRR